MILPPLLLPLSSIFNATSPLNSHDFGCYHQNPPNETQISTITYKECKAALDDIPMGEKALAPLTFGRNESAGFSTPYAWTHGRCQIGIDMLEADVEETTTFAAILERAFVIMVECVIKPPHFGGIGLMGENYDLQVTVRQR